MKKTYVIKMGKDSNPFYASVQFTVQAESEFDAIQQAKKRHPELQIASVKEK